ncbi:hypothetical protein RKD05_000676 [Microbacterium sp. SLBN-111]
MLPHRQGKLRENGLDTDCEGIRASINGWREGMFRQFPIPTFTAGPAGLVRRLPCEASPSGQNR